MDYNALNAFRETFVIKNDQNQKTMSLYLFISGNEVD